MSIVLHALQSVLSIAIMIIFGIILARRGWFDENSGKLIANLVNKVSLPCVVLLNITDNFSREHLLSLAQSLVLPGLSIVISYYIGAVLAKILAVPKGRRSIFKSMFYLSNCMYIGLPINIALFGENSIVYVFEYFIVNTIAMWGVGAWQMAVEGGNDAEKPGFFDLLQKIIFSPLLGFIIAIILVALGVTLPPLVRDTCRYLGAMTTPLSMLFIGWALSSTVWSDMKFTAEHAAALSGRFLIGPLAVFLLRLFIPAGDLEFKVMVIQSATPIAAAIPIMAGTYGLDIKYAAVLASISTALFVVTVPFYMWILH